MWNFATTNLCYIMIMICWQKLQTNMMQNSPLTMFPFLLSFLTRILTLLLIKDPLSIFCSHIHVDLSPFFLSSSSFFCTYNISWCLMYRGKLTVLATLEELITEFQFLNISFLWEVLQIYDHDHDIYHWLQLLYFLNEKQIDIFADLVELG